ncbi:MAG: phospholipase D-like domain-containing protein [Myxococcota bacterium]|nr:phospholipase D-like domain-containing protein [Myxococcota bacterium]
MFVHKCLCFVRRLLFGASVFLSFSRAEAAMATQPVSDIELIESVPVGTDLDSPSLGNAAETWLSMIRGAKSSLSIAQFYVSTKSNRRGKLEPVLRAIEDAGKRKVRVRFLVDAYFASKYPVEMGRIKKMAGVELRFSDWKGLTGGVHHAKYFVVDEEEAFIGSQNFDWRALEHILELGVRVHSKSLSNELLSVFNFDWIRAGRSEVGSSKLLTPWIKRPFGYKGREGEVQLVASPRDHIPEGATWDLPKILESIDGAKQHITIQLLSYSIRNYDGSSWRRIHNALKAATSRGVKLRMIVADWSKKDPKQAAVKALSRFRNTEVRFVKIPQFSGGFIPYARVVHAKFMVVDDDWSWLGTSNFSGDYFTKSRNVGLIIREMEFAKELLRFFQKGWDMVGSEKVVAQRHYLPPRVH